MALARVFHGSKGGDARAAWRLRENACVTIRIFL
jgi:hypothetical protein